ncbi:hypothetical protein [Candidatus Electronema sp. JM]|uniref:hypothetical protein n=1 Tax=Candidatus Electronema sp. JM TaxID=3401571 RepID=UPI003AA8A608
MKVTDSFACDLLDQDGELICRQTEGYVPSFFPDTSGGDYLDLHIHFDTGTIINWRRKEGSLREWVDSMNGMSDEQ